MKFDALAAGTAGREEKEGLAATLYGGKPLAIGWIGGLVGYQVRLSSDRNLRVENIEGVDRHATRPPRSPQIAIEGVSAPGAIDQGAQLAELILSDLGLIGPFENGINISSFHERCLCHG
jgi:hypothetical protein